MFISLIILLENTSPLVIYNNLVFYNSLAFKYAIFMIAFTF